MASQELSHVDTLYTQAVRLIQDHRAAGHEAPAGMQAVWDVEIYHLCGSDEDREIVQGITGCIPK